MNPVEYIKICFRKYADFSGRPIRPMRCPLRGRIGRRRASAYSLAVGAFGQCVAPYGGALAATFVGWIPLLVMAALPGTGGANRYGPAPHSANALPPTGAHWPQGGYGGPEPGHPYAPPRAGYGDAGGAESGGRQYCPQCGAERTAADARACIVCGAGF